LLDDRVMASNIFPLGVSYTNFSDPKTDLSGMSCLVRCLTAWFQRVWEAFPRNIPLKIRKRLLMAREQGWHTFRAEWLSTMKCVGLSRSKKRLDPEILVDRAQGRVRSSRVRRGFFWHGLIFDRAMTRGQVKGTNSTGGLTGRILLLGLCVSKHCSGTSVSDILVLVGWCVKM